MNLLELTSAVIYTFQNGSQIHWSSGSHTLHMAALPQLSSDPASQLKPRLGELRDGLLPGSVGLAPTRHGHSQGAIGHPETKQPDNSTAENA